VLLQLPILFGLYWVFWKGGLPGINTTILYSFVPAPPAIDMSFLGFIDMGERSILLALLTGVTQYVYTRLSMGQRQARSLASNPSFSEDMARSFDLQARYVLPVLFTAISYSLSAALPLYWATSNIFMIGQELLMIRSRARTNQKTL
jgi:membrane protein insertase Oxa1/YidC/SpoIIIJ